MATNATLVKGMLGPMYSSKLSLTSPIRTAGVIMARVRACAARKGLTIDPDTDQEMETALAAHVYQLMDPAYTSRSTLSASGSFEGRTEKRLEGTKFGQLALTLDPTNCLELVNDPKKQVSMKWLGKPVRDQTTYEGRND